MTSRPPALFARTRVARVSISADAYDHAMDSLVLLGGAHQPVPMTAQAIAEAAEYRALPPGASTGRSQTIILDRSETVHWSSVSPMQASAVGANGSGRGRPTAATLCVSARSGSPLS